MTDDTTSAERAYYNQRRPTGGSRRGFGELGLLLASLVLASALLEGGTRLWERGEPARGGYSPVRGRRSREPQNTAGYRDTEHSVQKLPGTRRAVFVGDSFTYGAGILLDDTYPKRLERSLSAERGERWESIVLAVPGVDTEQEAALVEQEALIYSPDVLVLGYVLNDAEDPDAAEHRRAAEWTVAEAARRNPPWWRRSALLSLVADRIRATRENRERIDNHLALYGNDAPGFARARKALDRIAALCQERSIPFVIVLFPLFANRLDEGYPFLPAHDKVAAAGRNAGGRVVDLLPYYRGMDWHLLVVEGALDEHPNELAHRIAAQAVLKELDSALLIPSRGLPSGPSFPQGRAQAGPG